MEFFLFLYVDMGVGMVERRQGQSKKKLVRSMYTLTL